MKCVLADVRGLDVGAGLQRWWRRHFMKECRCLNQYLMAQSTIQWIDTKSTDNHNSYVRIPINTSSSLLQVTTINDSPTTTIDGNCSIQRVLVLTNRELVTLTPHLIPRSRWWLEFPELNFTWHYHAQPPLELCRQRATTAGWLLLCGLITGHISHIK